MNRGHTNTPASEPCAPESIDASASEKDADATCDACGGDAHNLREYQEGEATVENYRCSECGAGGHLCVSPDGHILNGGGPVFERGQVATDGGEEVEDV